ncbi:MAG: metalloregulator ArsR/SmtB family transcription factor [Phycisphaerales bacterium]|jgi:ArsR family transcriptional regulator|nr:metalloregulator ArsR/SmtB family transcription factor [Phycisphaerales bacterium]
MSSTTPGPTATLLEQLGGLHDASRLRLMVLLDAHELAVGELAAAIQAPQSTVSRHLKRLIDAGWIQRRSVGPQSLYRVSSDDLDDRARSLWSVAAAGLRGEPTHAEDLRRVDEILSQRKTDTRAFFGATGADWAEVREQLFGTTLTHACIPAMLDPDWVVADLGCGTGQLAAAIGPWVGRIEAVDREPAMLEAARRRLADLDNVRFHEADMHAAALPAGSVDLAVMSLVLHHVEAPADAINAAATMLRPGGRLLIVDMVQHDRTEYRDTMGHVHLGFTRDEIAAWCDQAGVTLQRFEVLRPDPDAKGPGLFAATARAETAPPA